jgi:hypothetical protein
MSKLPIDLVASAREERLDDVAHDAREIRECIATIGGVVERLKRLRAPTMLTKRAESSLAATGLYLFAWRTEGDA